MLFRPILFRWILIRFRRKRPDMEMRHGEGEREQMRAGPCDKAPQYMVYVHVCVRVHAKHYFDRKSKKLEPNACNASH